MRSAEDTNLIARLRASGSARCVRRAELLERCTASPTAAEEFLAELRAEAASLGRNPNELFPATGAELLAQTRGAALYLLGFDEIKGRP